MKLIKAFGLFSALALSPTLAGAAESAEEHPTYARDVAPIIQDNCQICHQPGQIGPMSFTSYEEVRPWAPLIGTGNATVPVRYGHWYSTAQG